MKTISKSENIDDMKSFFKDLLDEQSVLTTWQAVDSGRMIQKTKISNFNQDDIVQYILAADDRVKFVPGHIFFYEPIKKVIFKSTVEVIEGVNFESILPNEVKFMDEEEERNLGHMLNAFHDDMHFVEGEGRSSQNSDNIFVAGSGEANIHTEKYLKGSVAGTDTDNDKESARNLSEQFIDKRMVAKTNTEKIETKWATSSMSSHDADLFATELSFIELDDEDKLYEGQRAAPRAKPPEGKMVTVQIHDETRPQSTHLLYDLSQGGISFFVFSSDEFSAGETLHIKGFDSKSFDQPMVAEVKSVREADAMGIQFKVGCAFSGQ